MSIDHTPGPWRYVQEDNAIVAADGFLISDCVPRSADFSMRERDANANRIVACVNACEGISTQDLDGSHFFAMRASHKQAIAERKQLTEALQEALQRWQDWNDLQEDEEIREQDRQRLAQIRAALTKAKP